MVVPFREGDIIRHFKRDMVSDEAKEQNMYLYKVLAVGMHTETKERMLVYQALYYPFGVFIRPLDMAMEEIFPDQYPYIPNLQKHRLEVCDESENVNYPNVIFDKEEK